MTLNESKDVFAEIKSILDDIKKVYIEKELRYNHYTLGSIFSNQNNLKCCSNKIEIVNSNSDLASFREKKTNVDNIQKKKIQGHVVLTKLFLKLYHTIPEFNLVFNIDENVYVMKSNSVPVVSPKYGLITEYGCYLWISKISSINCSQKPVFHSPINILPDEFKEDNYMFYDVNYSVLSNFLYPQIKKETLDNYADTTYLQKKKVSIFEHIRRLLR